MPQEDGRDATGKQDEQVPATPSIAAHAVTRRSEGLFIPWEDDQG